MYLSEELEVVPLSDGGLQGKELCVEGQYLVEGAKQGGVLKALCVALIKGLLNVEVPQILIPRGGGYIGLCVTNGRLILRRVSQSSEWRLLSAREFSAWDDLSSECVYLIADLLPHDIDLRPDRFQKEGIGLGVEQLVILEG